MSTEKDNNNKLITASMQGNLAEVTKLLAEGVKANVSDGYTTPIHQAAEHTSIEVAVALIEADPEVVHAKDGNMRTPLHHAAKHNNPNMVKMLIAHGANVNELDSRGFTPLHHAALFDSKDAAEMLIHHRAKINNEEGEGKDTPLHVAAQHNSNEVAKILIREHAKVDAVKIYQQTPLHVAAVYGSTDVATTLIRAHAKVDAVNKHQQTPLHLAAQNKHFEVIVQILRAYEDRPEGDDAIFTFHARQIMNDINVHDDISRIDDLVLQFREAIHPGRGQLTKVALPEEAVKLAAPTEAEEATQEDDDTAEEFVGSTDPVLLQASEAWGANTATAEATSTQASTSIVYAQMDLAIDFEVDFIGEWTLL